MRYFVAGGALRDLLLGESPRDMDIVFDGTPEDLQRAFPGEIHSVGQETPVFIRKGIEYVPLLHGSIQEDLTARDFTINALLMDESGIIHAHPQSFADLAAGIIRAASPSALQQDPVRVFRAARFCAIHPEFTIAPDTERLMREAALSGVLKRVSGERVGNEFRKTCGSQVPSTFFHVLARTDCLAYWFTELLTAREIPAGPAKYHGTDSVFDHSLSIMDTVASSMAHCAANARELGIWMGLCHDFGKILTPPEEFPRHLGHDKRGMELVTALVNRLRLPRLFEKAGHFALQWHMLAGTYDELRLATRVDFLHALNASGLDLPFAHLVAADSENKALCEILPRDLACIRAVRLPEAFRNLGERSAEKLRELRIDALRAQQKQNLP